jgi:hypothetical protein
MSPLRNDLLTVNKRLRALAAILLCLTSRHTCPVILYSLNRSPRTRQNRYTAGPVKSIRWCQQSTLILVSLAVMSSLPRPPPIYDKNTLSSFTNAGKEELELSGSASSASSTYSFSLEKKLPEPPYHVFTLAKKRQMVYIVSLAGLFSPLSSNIYFPALSQIATVSRNSKSPCTHLTDSRISMSACHL